MKSVIKLKKLIAILTTTSLLISFVVSPSIANIITQDQNIDKYKQIFNDFILPYSYGKITDSHYAATDRVIINIQDFHCHPQVQKNISNIIETFDKNYGVNKIYLEGAYGKVNTEWINKAFSNYKMLLEALDKMIETGRLTGAEYYSVKSGKTEIINGLEEKGPYLENLRRFGQIIENQEKIDLILKEIEYSTKNLKDKYYSKRQHKLEELFVQYKSGKMTSQKYYSILSKHIDRLGIDLTKYENTLIYIMILELQKGLDYSQVTKDFQELISKIKQQIPYAIYKSLLDNTNNFKEIEKLYSYLIQLSREYDLNIGLNFKELDKYFRYIELSKKINPIELVKEDDLLEQEINTRFSQTKAEQDVVFLIYFEKYLKDYVKSKITAKDYKYYSENIQKYRKLWNKYVDNKVLSLLDEYIAETDNFYKVNNDRNIYFTNNMFQKNDVLKKIETKQTEKDDINKIIASMKNVKEVDVVVTGGFHTQTVTDILKEKGVSYIVITPNITDGIKNAEQTYYQIAKEQSKISFQTIANLIVSLSPQAQQKLLNYLINPDEYSQIIESSEMSSEEKSAQLTQLFTARILESDDNKSLIDLIKTIVDEEYKEKITPELLRQIKAKQLPKLLENKEQLQKLIVLLQDNTYKQATKSVIEIIDYFNDVLNQIPLTFSKSSPNNISSKVNNLILNKYEKAKFMIEVEGEYFCIEVDRDNKIYLVSYNDNRVYYNRPTIYFDDYKQLFDKVIDNIDFKVEQQDDSWILSYNSLGNFRIEYISKDEEVNSIGTKIDLKEDAKQYKSILDYISNFSYQGFNNNLIPVSLEQDSTNIEEQIKSIFSSIDYYDKKNVSIALYPFNTNIDYSKMSDAEIYFLFDKILKNVKNFNEAFFKAVPLNFYGKRLEETQYFCSECIKNAFVHGNNFKNRPIVVSINLEKRNFDAISIINYDDGTEVSNKRLLSISSAVGISGMHSGISSFNFNGVYNYFDLGHKENSVYVTSVIDSNEAAIKRTKTYVEYLLSLEGINIKEQELNSFISKELSSYVGISSEAQKIVEKIKNNIKDFSVSDKVDDYKTLLPLEKIRRLASLDETSNDEKEIIEYLNKLEEETLNKIVIQLENLSTEERKKKLQSILFDFLSDKIINLKIFNDKSMLNKIFTKDNNIYYLILFDKEFSDGKFSVQAYSFLLNRIADYAKNISTFNKYEEYNKFYKKYKDNKKYVDYFMNFINETEINLLNDFLSLTSNDKEKIYSCLSKISKNKDVDIHLFFQLFSELDYRKIISNMSDDNDSKDIVTDEILFTLNIFMNPDFEKSLENKYKEFGKKLTILARYRVALKTARRLYSMFGDNVYKITQEQISNNSQKLVDYNSKYISELVKTIIFGSNMVMSSIRNYNMYEKREQRFSNKGIREILKLLKLDYILQDKERCLEHSFTNEEKLIDAKQDWLDFFINYKQYKDEYNKRYEGTNKRIDYLFANFDGHGGENLIYLMGGDEQKDLNKCISVEELAQAFLKSYQNGADLEEIILDLSCCNSYVFSNKVISRLKELEIENGLEERYPNIITEAGKETKLGYSIDYFNFTVGNMYHAIINYLEEKKLDSFSMEDLFDTDIEESNHTIFVTNSRIEELNKQFKEDMSKSFGITPIIYNILSERRAELQTKSTVENLEKIGNTKIIKKLYKEKAGANFRYTSLGVAIGVLLETREINDIFLGQEGKKKFLEQHTSYSDEMEKGLNRILDAMKKAYDKIPTIFKPTFIAKLAISIANIKGHKDWNKAQISKENKTQLLQQDTTIGIESENGVSLRDDIGINVEKENGDKYFISIKKVEYYQDLKHIKYRAMFIENKQEKGKVFDTVLLQEDTKLETTQSIENLLGIKIQYKDYSSSVWQDITDEKSFLKANSIRVIPNESVKVNHVIFNDNMRNNILYSNEYRDISIHDKNLQKLKNRFSIDNITPIYLEDYSLTRTGILGYDEEQLLVPIIKDFIEGNSSIALYPSRINLDINLSFDSKVYAYKYVSKYFLELSTLISKNICKQKGIDNKVYIKTLEYFINENLKNSFYHGNKCNLNLPIVISFDTQTQKIKFFNVVDKKTTAPFEAVLVGLTGYHKGTQFMQGQLSKEEKRILKNRNIDVSLLGYKIDLEEDFCKTECSILNDIGRKQKQDNRPGIIKELKSVGVENPLLFNFLTKFNNTSYIYLMNESLKKDRKNPISKFEEKLADKFEELFNKENFNITYKQAEKVYEVEMHILEGTDQEEYRKIKSILDAKSKIEELQRYINSKRKQVISNWKEQLKANKYTNVQRVLIAEGIKQYIKKSKTLSIPLEYVEKAFDMFIEQFTKSSVEEIERFKIYDEYAKSITEMVTDNGNNPEIVNVNYDYKGTEVKGKWIRIKGRQSIEKDKKGNVYLNKQILSAISSEKWCTSGRGGETTVLIRNGSDFYAFIEEEQTRATLGFVPTDNKEVLKSSPWYYGLFEQGNGSNNIIPERYDQAVIELQKEIKEGKNKDEKGYKTLEEIGYPNIIEEKINRREKQKQFVEKTKELEDYTSQEAKELLEEVFGIVLKQNETGKYTIHEITDGLIDEMFEVDETIVEKFFKTVNRAEEDIIIRNGNVGKYLKDLSTGGDLYLDNVTEIAEGVSLSAGGYLSLRNLTEIAEGVSLSASGDLYLRKVTELPEGVSLSAGRELSLGIQYLTKVDADRISKFIYQDLILDTLNGIEEGVSLDVKGSLLLGHITELPEGVSFSAGKDLIFVEVTKLIEGVSFSAGGDLYLPKLNILPENTESIKIHADDIKCENEQIREKLIEIRDRTLQEETLQTKSTVEKLEKIGNNKIIKKIYKDRAGENFRYTSLGVAIGAIIETFSLWSPNFIKQHENPTMAQKIVVWVIRALTIGIGVTVAISPLSAIAIIPSMLLTEWIIHYIWNITQISKENKNQLLQQDNRPGIIKELKSVGVENPLLFNFLTKFNNTPYIYLMKESLNEDRKNPVSKFEEKLADKFEELFNKENFNITYKQAEKVYEVEMHILEGTDQSEYNRIKSIFNEQKQIEEIRNYINSKRKQVISNWKEQLKANKYTNVQRVLIAEGIKQYMKKAKTLAIPLEYVEKAFDMFIDKFAKSLAEEISKFKIYDEYAKSITEIVTDNGNNPEVLEINYDYKGTEIKGKWIRIRGKQSIEKDKKGNLDLNKQILSAVSSEKWCTSGRGGESKVLEEHGSDFYVFIEEGQMRSSLGFVPSKDKKMLKKNPWYYGLFEQGNGSNNVIPEKYDQAVIELQKEIKEGKNKDEKGYQTLEEIGYPNIIEEKRNRREKQKQFAEKTKELEDYTSQEAKELLEETFGIVLKQNETGKYTIHEITNGLIDKMLEVDETIVEKFFKTVNQAEEYIIIGNGNVGKYIKDLKAGKLFFLYKVKELPKGVSLSSDESLILEDLTELPEEASLSASLTLSLGIENLTKAEAEKISNFKFEWLNLKNLKNIEEGVSLSANEDLDLSKVTELPEGVSLSAGGTLSLGIENLTKAEADRISNFKFKSLELWSLKNIEEGVSLSVDGDLVLNNLTELPKGISLSADGDLKLRCVKELPEEVSLSAGKILCLDVLTKFPKNTKYINLRFKEVFAYSRYTEKRLIKIGNKHIKKLNKIGKIFHPFNETKAESFNKGALGVAIGVLLETREINRIFLGQETKQEFLERHTSYNDGEQQTKDKMEAGLNGILGAMQEVYNNLPIIFKPTFISRLAISIVNIKEHIIWNITQISKGNKDQLLQQDTTIYHNKEDYSEESHYTEYPFTLKTCKYFIIELPNGESYSIMFDETANRTSYPGMYLGTKLENHKVDSFVKDKKLQETTETLEKKFGLKIQMKLYDKWYDIELFNGNNAVHFVGTNNIEGIRITPTKNFKPGTKYTFIQEDLGYKYPIESKKDISKKDKNLEKIKQLTDRNNYETFYLEDFSSMQEYEIEDKIFEAIKTKSLFAIYPSRESFDIKKLTIQGIYNRYLYITINISKFSRLFSKVLQEKFGIETSTKYFMKEIIKNAFGHGNKYQTDLGIYIDVPIENNRIHNIKIYNAKSDIQTDDRLEFLSAVSELHGFHLGNRWLNYNQIEDENEKEKIQKVIKSQDVGVNLDLLSYSENSTFIDDTEIFESTINVSSIYEINRIKSLNVYMNYAKDKISSLYSKYDVEETPEDIFYEKVDSFDGLDLYEIFNSKILIDKKKVIIPVSKEINFNLDGQKIILEFKDKENIKHIFNIEDISTLDMNTEIKTLLGIQNLNKVKDIFSMLQNNKMKVFLSDDTDLENNIESYFTLDSLKIDIKSKEMYPSMTLVYPYDGTTPYFVTKLKNKEIKVYINNESIKEIIPKTILDIQEKISEILRFKKQFDMTKINTYYIWKDVIDFENTINCFKYATDLGRKENAGRQEGLYVDLQDYKGEVIVIGDVHADLLKVMQKISANREKLDKGEAIIVFEGDYIHNERNLEEMESSLATIEFIMDLKIAYPKSVYLLAGNHDVSDKVGKSRKTAFHDTEDIFQGRLFYKKLEDKYGKESAEMFKKTMEENLAIVAEGDDFIIIHGGPIRYNNWRQYLKINKTIVGQDSKYSTMGHALWGRYGDTYGQESVIKFAGTKHLIVGHTHQKNFYGKICKNHTAIIDTKDTNGFGIIKYNKETKKEEQTLIESIVADDDLSGFIIRRISKQQQIPIQILSTDSLINKFLESKIDFSKTLLIVGDNQKAEKLRNVNINAISVKIFYRVDKDWTDDFSVEFDGANNELTVFVKEDTEISEKEVYDLLINKIHDYDNLKQIEQLVLVNKNILNDNFVDEITRLVTPEESIVDDVTYYISNTLSKIFFINTLINTIFKEQNLSTVISNKKLLITRTKQQETQLKQVLKDNNVDDIAIVTMEIIKEPTEDKRSQLYLDVDNGIKARYDVEEKKIIVYSKQGITISEEEIEQLIMQSYFAERNEDIIDDSVAFAEFTDMTLNDITNRLNNIYTDLVVMPNKDTKFDISNRKISDITTTCKQEFISTGIKTFVITLDQAINFAKEIKQLQDQDFKFIVMCDKSIVDVDLYDGLLINATDISDINQATQLLENAKKKVAKQGLAKQVSIKFSDDIYQQLDNLKINIFDKYGIIPIIDASTQNMNLKNIGKTEVVNITEDNVEQILRNNNVFSLIIDNARIFAGKKEIIKEIKTKEQKYNKGYNASLNSKFNYTCVDVSKLAQYLSVDINDSQKLEQIFSNINLSQLSLSSDSQSYLEYLLSKQRYEEMLGFIRGITLNTARKQVIDKFAENGATIDIEKLKKTANGKYQKAFFTLAVQLMLEGQNITDLLDTGFINSDMTMVQYLEIINEKVNISMDDILKQNEYKITKLSYVAKAIDEFKNFVEMLDNLKIVKEQSIKFDMSIKSVKSMLKAA